MPLAKYAAAVYAVPVSYGQSVPTKRVIAWAEKQSLPVSEHATAADGFAATRREAKHDEIIVVCGSLYLVAEFRQDFMEGDVSAKHETAESL